VGMGQDTETFGRIRSKER